MNESQNPTTDMADNPDRISAEISESGQVRIVIWFKDGASVAPGECLIVNLPQSTVTALITELTMVRAN